MANNNILTGTVHKLPSDLKEVLVSNINIVEKWNNLTPLARNEWICWVTNVKKAVTRISHLDRIGVEILGGKRRPCCWSGCPHRRDKAKNKNIKQNSPRHIKPHKFFQKTLYRENNLDLQGKIDTRLAVRGLILRKNKLLMLYSKKFKTYSLPGGGVNQGESLADAVRREIREETGYRVANVSENAGCVIEYDSPRTKNFAVYKRINNYFFLEITGKRGRQKFEKDEIEYQYVPLWVNPAEVLTEYNKIIKNNKSPEWKWIFREKYVLEKIIKNLKSSE